MAQEIERKFLVINDHWRTEATGILYRQAYLNTDKQRTVRIRIIGEQAFITIKGITRDICRLEFEYPIAVEDAHTMIDQLAHRPIIEKYRYQIKQQDLIWEIDEFLGENQGLIIAEVELSHPDQKLVLPEWIGAEVSHDPRYFNNNLVTHPFQSW
ncbi:CYTH domain-containing protein [Neisseriaceae bacterium ESL0693]|nr:CYTH domain-containing protein [Neisseriaceae bacterium ESL0693]